MSRNKNLNFQRITLWLLTAGFVWFFLKHYAEIKQLVHVVASGRLIYIFLALIAQVLYYFFYNLIFQFGYRVVNIKTKIREMLPITLTSVFINVIAPSGGASAVALYADGVIKKKNNPAAAVAGPLLAFFADLTAFFGILIFSLIYLFRHNGLATYQLVLSGLLLLIILFLLAVILAGLWQEQWLRAILKFGSKISNKVSRLIIKKDYFTPEKVEKIANDFVENSHLVRTRKKAVLETIGIALVAHAVDILSLALVFTAFAGKPNAEVVLAGYAMGILFWIVSIVPQGIGIVEGAMTVTFTSLGVPPVYAATIAIVWRGLTFWLPFFAGFVLMRKVKSFQSTQTRWTEIWSVRIAAILAAFVGLVNITSAVTPPLAHRMAKLTQDVPAYVTRGSHFTTVIAGFALLYLARGLWTRRRLAWLITVIVLAVSGVSHLFKGLDYEESTLSFAFMVLLIYWRNHFHTLSSAPSVKQGLKTLLGAFFFTIFYGTLGFYFFDFEYKVHFNIFAALRQVFIMFFQLYNPGLEPVSGFGRYFASSIYAVATITMGYALITILKPFLNLPHPSKEDFQRAKNIVEMYGRTSLARFAIFNDKLFFFSSGGSLISYTVKGDIALALGDPIGPEIDATKAISEFKSYCIKKYWTPAFYQTMDYSMKRYEKNGFKTLSIGQEAIVELSQFSIEGKEGKPFRNILNKFAREQFKFEILEPPISDEVIKDLEIVSEEWLTLMHGKEKSFSLGWFDKDYIRCCKISVIRTLENEIIAFGNIIPEYNLNELTVDLMRKTADSPNGTMDFMFTNIMLWGKENKYDTFNFGLSPLSGVGLKSDDPIIEKFIGTIYKHFNTFYSFQGLHAYKAKYHPLWSPRYLVYQRAIDLPAVATSIIRADSGDDFILDYVKDLSGRIFRKK